MIKLNAVTKIFQPHRNPFKLRKSVESVTAVDNISFECKPGRIFGLIGPNGAGKTTTLRMIATMLKPTSGNISIGNIELEKSIIKFI